MWRPRVRVSYLWSWFRQAHLPFETVYLSINVLSNVVHLLLTILLTALALSALNTYEIQLCLKSMWSLFIDECTPHKMSLNSNAFRQLCSIFSMNGNLHNTRPNRWHFQLATLLHYRKTLIFCNSWGCGFQLLHFILRRW